MNSYINIINGVRRNERKAQMAFYDLFFRPVYQSAFAVAGNHDEAEEIMHDTLLKVFSKTGLLNEEPKAMSRILRRMATNQAIDILRKRKDFILPIADGDAVDWEDETEEDSATNELTISDIKDGISRLSPAYRSIISLRLFEEISFAEISEQLNINASTVRVQYSRGITQLRILLQQQINGLKYE